MTRTCGKCRHYDGGMCDFPMPDELPMWVDDGCLEESETPAWCVYKSKPADDCRVFSPKADK